MYFMFSSFQPFRPLSLQQSIYFFLFVCWQDLLEAVKPILDEDVQEAVESLLMDSAAYDAKNLYNATKVRNTRISYSVQVFAIRWFYQEVYFLLSLKWIRLPPVVSVFNSSLVTHSSYFMLRPSRFMLHTSRSSLHGSRLSPPAPRSTLNSPLFTHSRYESLPLSLLPHAVCLNNWWVLHVLCLTSVLGCLNSFCFATGPGYWWRHADWGSLYKN